MNAAYSSDGNYSISFHATPIHHCILTHIPTGTEIDFCVDSPRFCTWNPAETRANLAFAIASNSFIYIFNIRCQLVSSVAANVETMSWANEDEIKVISPNGIIYLYTPHDNRIIPTCMLVHDGTPYLSPCGNYVAFGGYRCDFVLAYIGGEAASFIDCGDECGRIPFPDCRVLSIRFDEDMQHLMIEMYNFESMVVETYVVENRHFVIQTKILPTMEGHIGQDLAGVVGECV